MDESKEVSVSFKLKGEEAIEFLRFVRKTSAPRKNYAAKTLVVEGLKHKGYLPRWWVSKR